MVLTNIKEDDLITVAEAARALRVAPRTVTKYRQEGKLSYIQYSPRKFLYYKPDIEQFIASSYHEPQMYLF